MSRILLISLSLITLVIVGVKCNAEDDLEAIVCKKVETKEGQDKLTECQKNAPQNLLDGHNKCKKEIGHADTNDVEFTKKCCKDKDLGKKLHECNMKMAQELMKTDKDFMNKIKPIIECIKA